MSVLTCEIDELDRGLRDVRLDERGTCRNNLDEACRSGLSIPQGAFLGLPSLLTGMV
jgi:hypothetical protein